MPTLKLNDTELYYEDHGTGKRTVLMLHGLGFSGRMFHNQVLALRERYRCITLDFRGQGRSAVARTGYDMDTLTEDVVSILRKLDATPCHVMGLSMGGFVALRLALDHPTLVRTLILMNTSARREPIGNRLRYGLLAQVTRVVGLRPVAGTLMHKLFGKSFMDSPARAGERKHWRNELLAQPRTGLRRAARGVVRRAGLVDRLSRIMLPTLIFAGEEDVATPVHLSRELNTKITGSTLIELPKVGHNCSLEAPVEVTETLRRFLREHEKPRPPRR